jgi:hypothetical protein
VLLFHSAVREVYEVDGSNQESVMPRRKLTPEECKLVEWRLKWCTEHTERLSESAIDFLISVEDQYRRDGMLSDAQLATIAGIYERLDR